MKQVDPRAELDRLIRMNGDDYVSISRLLGRNTAYIQQYLKRGSPKKLGEDERAVLARYFGVDEQLLGAPLRETAKQQLQMVPQLAVGASAGAGALDTRETLAGKVGFDIGWLRKLGVDPAHVSLIRVQGNSMAPTLSDGDDIMVDAAAATRAPKKGIYVIRIDGALMVKRILPGAKGTLSVLSDNPDHQDMHRIEARIVDIVGRVVWAARKL